MIFAFDIETFKNGRAESIIDKMEFKAPGNYKTDKAIYDNIAKQRATALDKAALHWTTGRVTSIAIVDLDSDYENVFCDLDEKKVLQDFAKDVSRQDTTIVGKSSDDFDVPFLIGRFMANKLTIPPCLRNKTMHEDIDKIFGYSMSAQQRGKLSLYCDGLGIEGKTAKGTDALVMWQRYLDGDQTARAELMGYNLHDCYPVKKIYKLYHGLDSQSEE